MKKFKIDPAKGLSMLVTLLGIAGTLLSNKVEENTKKKMKEDLKKEILEDISQSK